MKDLFDRALAEQLKQRIMRLEPYTAPQWGHMTVAQTFAHCTSGIQMAMGVINPNVHPFLPTSSARSSSR